MIQKLRNSFALKVFSLVVLFSMVLPMIQPLQTFALTSGPSQPEFDDFTPVGSSDLVDMFSGDFSYNIPLLNIPGPNGGYPINIGYQAGIGMEQEASWVGLGWSLNPGAINRNMRGIPDDFKGDLIHNELYMKPNVTIGVGLKNTWPEIFGANTEKLASNLSLDYQFFWNNYRGTGHSLGLGLTATMGEKGKYNQGFGLHLSVSSSDGATVSGSYSGGIRQDQLQNMTSLGINYSSRQGITDIGLMQSTSIRSKQKVTAGYQHRSYASGHEVGVHFSSNGNVPNLGTDFNGMSGVFSFSYQQGVNADVEVPTPTIMGHFSASWLDDKSKTADVKAYGYNYTAEREALAGDDERAIFDFSKEKDYPIHPKVPNLPIPQFNNDQLFVSGHGVGGSFRPYRSDHGLLYDPTNESDFGAVTIGVEIGNAGATTKLGLNLGGMYSYGYSGKWQNGLDNFYQIKNFKQDHELLTADRTYTSVQPYHYQFNNEINIVPTNFFDKVAGENALDISFNPALGDITSSVGSSLGTSSTGTTPSTSDLSVNAQVTLSGLNNNSGTIKDIFKTKNAIEYFTRAEKSQSLDFNETTKVAHIYKLGEYPLITASYSSGYPKTISQSDALNTGSGSLSNSISHHIGEYTVQNEAGVKYTYGLPSYSISQEMVAFALKETTDQGMSYGKTASYVSGTDDKIENGNGNDHFYSAQKIPHHATTYLLTEIKGPDYVDLTGNGISDDDLGYFVKLNYSPLTTDGNYFGWRMPYSKETGYYNPGYLQYTKDNKATVMFGEKEIWYLNSIETKTHIAVFRLSDRADGLGVTNRQGNPKTTLLLKKLDKIDLYSKKDIQQNPSTPLAIKSVCFEYSYDLCGNVPNNLENLGGSYADEGHPHHCYTTHEDNNNNKGKLTLKKIYFTYGNNNKGKSSPYYFDYYERNSNCSINTDNNPDYSIGQVDRWGNYRPDNVGDPYDRYKNEENSYVDQRQENKDVLDQQIAAWNLREITAPSGSKTKITYEMDDYSHIQDKVAGEMCEVVGIGSGSGNDYFFSNASSVTEELALHKSDGSAHNRIYFKPEYPLPNTGANDVIKKYVEGLNDDFLYFKSFLKLAIPKNLTDNFVSDYVDGYCKLAGYGYEDITNGEQIMGFNSSDPIYSGVSGLNFNRIPYIEIIPTQPNGRHPFSYTGWQYLKNHRPDILTEDYGAATINPVGIIASVISILESVGELFAGFNNIQFMKGHCIKLKEERPSYIRLSSPDNKKYGGGHRVKSVEVNDNWNSVGGTASTYGQKYFYQMENGESSGVAPYEPLTGGNEISLRKPHYYSDNLIMNDPINYLEYPLGESFYPSASVGYRRVLVEDINQGVTLSNGQKVLKNNGGISEYRFYTAKDFPVITGKTDEVVDATKQHLIFPIPLIGMFSLKSDNYTQGYKIELNSMHGQIRSMATFDSDYDNDGNGIWDGTGANNIDYTNRVVYTYKTQQPYTPDGANRLNNEVDVLVADGLTEEALMGVNYDFYTHMEQNSNFSIMAGLDLNLIIVSGIAPIPTFFPSIELSYDQAKIMVTNKVLYKQGILTKVENFSEGTVSTTENLLWDAESGNVLLSRTSTDYNDHNDYGTVDEPVNDYIYNYDMPAHWAYAEMQGNYKNYRTLFTLEEHPSSSQSGYTDNFVMSVTDPDVYTDKLLNGDMIMIYKKSLSGLELIPAGTELCYWVRNLMMDQGSGSVVPAFTFELYNKSGSLMTMPGIRTAAGVSSGTTLYAKVITPIRTNQQSTMAGNIVTLSNPLTSRTSPFLMAYNSLETFTSMKCGGDGVTENTEPPFPLMKYFCFTNCEGQTLYGSKNIYTINGVNYLIILVDPVLSNVIYDPNREPVPCTDLRIQLPSSITGFDELVRINSYSAWFNNASTSEQYSLPIIQTWGRGDGRTSVSTHNDCIADCMDGVLDAGSIDFANNFQYDYTDHGKIGTAVTGNNNKYRTGVLGIWRPKQTNLYLVDRKQKSSAANSFKTYTGKDGTYEHFTIYIWKHPSAGLPVTQLPWKYTNIYTRYSPYGQNVEIRNAILQNSSTIYGYSESLPTAVASNAAYLEIGYDGFEDYGVGSPVTYYGISPDDHNNGHLPIMLAGNASMTLTNGTGHTGNYSAYLDLKTTSNTAKITGDVVATASALDVYNSSRLRVVKNKAYWISVWIKKDRNDVNFTSSATIPGVSIYDGVTTTAIRLDKTTIGVEGWYKVEGMFTISNTATTLEISLLPGQKTSSEIKAYFDDLRVQPFSSNMNAYVYDYNQLYKTAELDANNYATFYIYDEEGTLVQVKKETEKGVATIQQSRSNIKQ
jgi:hypothetical protein